MLIAREKKYSNIAEYILYMYQLEDVMRACNLDEKLVDEHIVSKFNADIAVRAEISAWYRELIMAMKDQKIEKSGHLEYLRLQIAELSDFNYAILQENEDEEYADAFKSALPALADIVQISGGIFHIIVRCNGTADERPTGIRRYSRGCAPSISFHA